MQGSRLVIPVVFLLVGFISAYMIFAGSDNNPPSHLIDKDSDESITEPDVLNPFSSSKYDDGYSDRFGNIEQAIVAIKQQLTEIETTLSALSDVTPTVSAQKTVTPNHRPSNFSQRAYNLDSLIRGGLSPLLAENIIRRKNSIELKRLALQDKAKRENYLNTQRYFDELDEINRETVSLRDELGDEKYDEYLFNSKQNNRIRIASVMLGSVAEQSGIQKGDVVLSYNNKRMFSWQELKDATAEGELGEFISISIYRGGEIYSYTVPRGPLGVKLGAARLEP